MLLYSCAVVLYSLLCCCTFVLYCCTVVLCCCNVQFTSDLTKMRETGGKCGTHEDRPEGKR